MKEEVHSIIVFLPFLPLLRRRGNEKDYNKQGKGGRQKLNFRKEDKREDISEAEEGKEGR